MKGITRSLMAGAAALGVAMSVAPAAYAIPAGTSPPTGGDPAWHSLAISCFQGSMNACDGLAKATKGMNAPVFFQYGFSCGGRVHYDQAQTDQYASCIDQFPGSP